MSIDEIFEGFPSEEELMNIIMHTSSTAWENTLVEKDIENWLQNFQGDVLDSKRERLLALWLLSHFTYYNQEEVTHLCKVIYRDLIHLIANKNVGMDYKAVVEDFFSKSNIISPEETSGSGGFIAYFFRHENHLPMTLFNFSLDNIADSTENLLIIDDVTLTAGIGGQIYAFFEKAKKTYPTKNLYLLSLVSSAESLKTLNNDFGVEIVSAIKLDERDKCFNTKSDIFCSYPNLIETAKSFAEHYGKKIGITDPLGYKNGEYTFGFFYNTPDNALPIFWARVNGWTPILRRYHKNYSNKNYLGNERFI